MTEVVGGEGEGKQGWSRRQAGVGCEEARGKLLEISFTC